MQNINVKSDTRDQMVVLWKGAGEMDYFSLELCSSDNSDTGSFSLE